MPSRYEPFGLAAAEVQAMGIPVLVSENTGYAELVLPGRSGIILKNQEDIKEDFTKLQYLIENPAMSPSEIREQISHLDNDIIIKNIINKFIKI
ncbi:MAG TPA: glycosyltransferase [Smithellaceae bacterium]|nr:glycosyltransferase [Smithellaceae bacterium]